MPSRRARRARRPAGPQVRYFDLSSGIFSDLSSEAILKENRQGNTLVSAELEVCHQASPTSNRLDRFVVPLKVEGNRLTGSGQSLEGKQAVSVNLTRRVAGGNFNFEGTVTSGSNTEKVQSTDNNEMTEEEITEQFLAEPAIEASPADFTAAWPQALHVRVDRAALGRSAGGAPRPERAGGLQRPHPIMPRSAIGHTIPFRSTSKPSASARSFAKVKSVPGVTEAGFSSNTPNMARAVRFPSAGWRDGAGKLDRDKLAAAVGAAFAKAMSATVSSTSWDPTMGELAVELKRPDETIPGLKLTQVITITAVIAPESLSSNQQSILWVESITPRIVDDRPAPRLTFSLTQPDEGGEGQASEPEGTDALPAAVAAALKGALWDPDKDQWRP